MIRFEGLVPLDSKREMAEFDAWYVLGVDKARNEAPARTPWQPISKAYSSPI